MTFAMIRKRERDEEFIGRGKIEEAKESKKIKTQPDWGYLWLAFLKAGVTTQI